MPGLGGPLALRVAVPRVRAAGFLSASVGAVCRRAPAWGPSALRLSVPLRPSAFPLPVRLPGVLLAGGSGGRPPGSLFGSWLRFVWPPALPAVCPFCRSSLPLAPVPLRRGFRGFAGGPPPSALAGCGEEDGDDGRGTGAASRRGLVLAVLRPPSPFCTMPVKGFTSGPYTALDRHGSPFRERAKDARQERSRYHDRSGYQQSKTPGGISAGRMAVRPL